MPRSLDITILGLSITSSWGNGHATTFRSLVRGLTERGHRITFFERDVPWYAENRDLPAPPHGRTVLYGDLDELRESHRADVRDADLVIVGSYVPEGIAVGRWVTDVAAGTTAFYDIDTPVTLAAVEAETCDYLNRELIAQYDLYLSFTGGPTLRRLEQEYGAAIARPLYCSVDAALYRPMAIETDYDLGYMGTYSADRQPALDRLLLEPAAAWPNGRFVVAGSQFPAAIVWPDNVHRIDHLAPSQHAAFYNSQRFTLNVTRAGMVRTGYAPSVRLFEAAACGVPIISDRWAGIEEVFEPDREILLADGQRHVLEFLQSVSDDDCRSIGTRARDRVLREHTAGRRAADLERHFEEAVRRSPRNVPNTLV